MTRQVQEGREYQHNERALRQAEQHYDRQHPPQVPPSRADSDRAWELDWLFRRNVED